MNLANKLTLTRMASVPFFMIYMVVDNFYTRCISLAIFIIAALTDYYDGKIARERKEVTNLGKFMDPLADKLLISAAFISFVGVRELSFPAWMVVLVISREFIINGLRTLAATQGKIIGASLAGKFKTTTQVFAIIIILVILVARSIIQTFYHIDPETLLFKGGLLKILWYVINFMPITLLMIVVVLTLASGLNYIIRNRHLLLF